MLRRQLKSLFIAGFGAVELLVRGVNVTQREVGDEILGIEFLQLQEIFFFACRIVHVAR